MDDEREASTPDEPAPAARDEGVEGYPEAAYVADVVRGTLGLSAVLRWYRRRAVD